MKQVHLPPFYYLNHTITILCIDDDPDILTFIRSIIEPCNIYSLLNAQNSTQADQLFNSANRIHCCLFDLGITNQNNDQFYLVKRYGKRIPFILFSGRNSMRYGFDAHRFGVKAIIEKSSTYSPVDFIHIINQHTLRSIINPKYNEENKDSLTMSTDILFDKNPTFVSQWASEMGMTDRALRYIWSNNLGANAKIILSIYQMYSKGLTYYESMMGGGPQSKNHAIVELSSQYRRLEEFFHLHKSTIIDFLSFGNIAAFP